MRGRYDRQRPHDWTFDDPSIECKDRKSCYRESGGAELELGEALQAGSSCDSYDDQLKLHNADLALDQERYSGISETLATKARKGCPSDGLVFPRLQAGATLFKKTSIVFGRKFSKPLQRLRSSCETYLVNEAGFALTDGSRWLGHNPATALKYYKQSSPATLERAMMLGA